MAIFQTHCRSISLPSRLHPISPTNLETEIEKLKHSASNSEAIKSAVLNLAEFCNSVEDVTTMQSRHQDEASMEESLSSSVELLDACNAIRELVQMMKESIQVLQSSLRRKGAADPTDIAAYFSCRKRMNKSIAKMLRSLKKSEQSMMKNGDGSVLREVRGVTMSVFKDVLGFLSLPAMRSWSLVSKLMIGKSGRESCDDDVNEVGNVDLSLSSLQKMTGCNGARVLDVQKKLQNLDSVVEGLEGGLEVLFRQLVRIRVTLLNILTDR